ncbi:PREDICTED: putative F-box protein PP2-B12 [Fragaria vesca subsp. vesca]|uniref:putative F-box protein PP2-B12 n=1 Tax=Fragaria vesca subsp. vesca TaxID=101020 RepID=UPI0002C338F7|nr:PREDICTED: putative F-box protein PP2-B12 [Fragaria vesca subsp. vesca]
MMDLLELPEGCIAHIISLTTPRDACRLSLLSKLFGSAADSDAVWDKFLPPETRTLSPEELGVLAGRTKKEVFLALCPVLFREGKLSFSLDKWSGKKCYMISARELGIAWGNTPMYWRWISDPESRFAEVAELLDVCWLEIHGKLETRLLSPSTMYKGYLVFKFTAQPSGFVDLEAEVTMGLDSLEGGEIINRTEFLHSGVRSDGWLEIEMGEFYCVGGSEDGMLKMRCLANGAGHWKRGLIVQGIEVRPKREY